MNANLFFILFVFLYELSLVKNGLQCFKAENTRMYNKFMLENDNKIKHEI
jgi:hypothetical protein